MPRIPTSAACTPSPMGHWHVLTRLRWSLLWKKPRPRARCLSQMCLWCSSCSSISMQPCATRCCSAPRALSGSRTMAYVSWCSARRQQRRQLASPVARSSSRTAASPVMIVVPVVLPRLLVTAPMDAVLLGPLVLVIAMTHNAGPSTSTPTNKRKSGCFGCGDPDHRIVDLKSDGSHVCPNWNAQKAAAGKGHANTGGKRFAGGKK